MAFDNHLILIMGHFSHSDSKENGQHMRQKGLNNYLLYSNGILKIKEKKIKKRIFFSFEILDFEM